VEIMREAARRLRSGGRIVNFFTSVVGTKFENYGVYADLGSRKTLPRLLPLWWDRTAPGGGGMV
jgi:hypothetical protein